MSRFSKGTTDHDGDGHMGGSRRADHSDKGPILTPSRSDHAPDPGKEDNTMARAPKTTTDTAPAAPAAPAQPWAQPTPATPDTTTNTSDQETPQNDGAASEGNGGGTDGDDAAVAPAASSDDAVRFVTSTDDIPTMDASSIPGQDEGDDVDTNRTFATVEKIAENDVASTDGELPSFVRDQISPSGVDVALEMDRSERPSLERSAYPSLGERLQQMLTGASADVVEQFEDRMVEVAQSVIEELRNNTQDRDFNESLIDGTAHYGPRVAANSALQEEQGVSGAELNRRARRAVERVSRAASSQFTGK